ncbi:TolC family protein [Thermodesulfatator atlanticus]|uniref:TolC family protein n=1 Tax=Thermodesulfatator atlanticus TaxID=501497 RepID=UPI0003B5E12C|nr:TolC family protein [Thermodesulfatator atlanticus]
MRVFFISLVALFCLLTGLSFATETLTLNAAIRKALDTHPALKARKENIEAASYARKAARANRWLKVDFAAQYTRHSDPVTVTPLKGPGLFPPFSRDLYSWQLNFTLPLYEGGRVAQEVRLKKLEGQMAKSLLRQSAEDLIANVKQLYLQILFLKELYQADQEITNLLRKLYDEAKLKYQLGKIPRLDLLHFQRALQEQEASLFTTRENLALAKRLLALLMGEDKARFEVTGSLKGTTYPKDLKIETLVNQRPDVRLALLNVKKAEAAMARIKKDYYPQVSAFSSYGRQAGSGFHHDEEIWVAGLRLDLRLFDSGVRRERLREKKSLFLAAKENLLATRLKARQEITSALTRVKTAREQIEKYKAAEEYARSAYEREAVRYQTGAGTITELLQTQEAWLRIKAGLLKAYYDLKSAEVAFELATGTISKGFLDEKD